MKTVEEIQKIADEIRLKLFQTIANTGSGHFGGNLSLVDLMSVLYFREMEVNADDPKAVERDRLVMSKGHAGPVLYTILAQKGFIQDEELLTLDKPGSRLQKHVYAKVPGIDVSTGSLGQGLSVAVGMAMGLRASNLSNYVYAILGDGECNEGQIWEAAMTAGKYHLNRLIVIVDRNNLQIDGTTEDVMPLEPFFDKWKSFGFFVQEIDGHNIGEIVKAVEAAKNQQEKPSVIIANTIKGKGVSFMENNLNWHASSISQEQIKQATAELEAAL